MSTSQKTPLHDCSNLQSNLQIRVVPYSPPRLSPECSTAAHTAEDTCSLSSGLSPANVEVHQHDTPLAHRRTAESSPAVSTPTSPIGPYSQSSSQDGDKRRASTARRPSTSSSTRRLKHVINVHADKTFSLLPQTELESSSVYSSSFLNSTVTNSTYGRNSSVTFSYGRRSSTLPPQQEDSAPTSPEGQRTPPKLLQKGTVRTSSPWNYEFVGGLRKVHPNTPDSESSAGISPIVSPGSTYAPLLDVEKYGSDSSQLSIPGKLLPGSFTPCLGESTTGSFTLANQTLPTASPDWKSSLDFDNISPSASQNYRVLADSGSSDYSLGSQSRPRTEDSEPNYIKHDEGLSPSTRGNSTDPGLKSQFSRESLIVPPLNTARKLFGDGPVSIKLPQGRSSPRFLAAWSAVINQDAARAMFVSRLYPSRRRHSSGSPEAGSAAATPRSNQYQNRPPLSTVISESEVESERISYSLSPFATEANIVGQSAELAGDDMDRGEYSFTRQVTPTSEPVDWPQAAYSRGKEQVFNSPNFRLVGDQDEHGDALTDLRELIHHRPSRRGGLPGISPTYIADRNLLSSASGRATNWAIPAWARLYYGGGERRFLTHQASRDSIRSWYTDNHTGGSQRRRSPSVERFGFSSQLQIGAPPAGDGRPPISLKRSYPDMSWARTLKKQTSSLWSPHLRRDKRASTYGIWDPPAGVLPVEGCITAKRNVQVVLFMSGFLFPIAWMVAAFLPLPTNRRFVEKTFPSTSHIDLTEDDGANPAQLAKEIALYNRAKWWRDLNRAMSVIGLLIIGAFAVLVALGVQQRWR